MRLDRLVASLLFRLLAFRDPPPVLFASFLGESSSPSFPVLSTKLMLTILPCLAAIVLLRRRILRLV